VSIIPSPKHKNVAQRRPAETSAASAASIVAALAALGVEVSEEAVVAIVVAVGFLPAVVTAIVERVRSL